MIYFGTKFGTKVLWHLTEVKIMWTQWSSFSSRLRGSVRLENLSTSPALTVAT